MKKAQIGVIGLAVMGANLARNFASKKIPTVVYNRTTEKTEEFITDYGNEYLEGCYGLAGFIESIELPRKIVIMVKAGEAVDAVIQQLQPLLSKGDIIIDGGNSNFNDTIRREKALSVKGIHFMGCGISGGEEGALKGPSLMPGGSEAAWKKVKPILEYIAAKDFKGKPCVAHTGTGASGHYVKMVHNGIEYAVMQLIAEAYNLLQIWPPQPAPMIADVFENWNKGKLNSFLFGIVPQILRKVDELESRSKTYLIDSILDKAEQKGTGTWTVQEGLNLGIAVPNIAQAVFARATSSRVTDRENLSANFDFMSPHQKRHDEKDFHKILGDALHISILLTYAQGFDLLRAASEKHNWNINLAEVVRIWQGGCIIRAKVLVDLQKSFATEKKSSEHLLYSSYLTKECEVCIPGLKEILHLTSETFVATPVLSASLSYFNAFTTQCSPANLIQGMRDYFGAHTYERTDRKGSFHTEWDPES
jgi:6-phosphogluconate dehydrogenase